MMATNFLKQLQAPRQYNVVIAYIMYFVGGTFGLHHFYLKRDRHAFVCSSSVGGGFCIGLIYDFFYIPSYVRQANRLQFLKKKSFDFTDPENRPSMNINRLSCQVLFGAYFGTLFLAMFPVEFFKENFLAIMICHAFAVALGVYTIANIGKIKCSFVPCLMGALIPTTFGLVMSSEDMGVIVFYTALSSSIVAFYRGWRFAEISDINNSNIFLRFITVYGLSFFIYLLLFNAIYWNTRVTVGGVKTSLGDYLEHNVPWEHFLNSLRKLFKTLRESGWVEFFLQAVEMMTAESFDVDALKVLELDGNATESEIISQYRKMAKIWHPDKYIRGSAWDKKWAEKQFILVRQAYEQLISHAKRHRVRVSNDEL